MREASKASFSLVHELPALNDCWTRALAPIEQGFALEGGLQRQLCGCGCMPGLLAATPLPAPPSSAPFRLRSEPPFRRPLRTGRRHRFCRRRERRRKSWRTARHVAHSRCQETAARKVPASEAASGTLGPPGRPAFCGVRGARWPRPSSGGGALPPARPGSGPRRARARAPALRAAGNGVAGPGSGAAGREQQQHSRRPLEAFTPRGHRGAVGDGRAAGRRPFWKRGARWMRGREDGGAPPEHRGPQERSVRPERRPDRVSAAGQPGRAVRTHSRVRRQKGGAGPWWRSVKSQLNPEAPKATDRNRCLSAPLTFEFQAWGGSETTSEAGLTGGSGTAEAVEAEVEEQRSHPGNLSHWDSSKTSEWVPPGQSRGRARASSGQAASSYPVNPLPFSPQLTTNKVSLQSHPCLASVFLGRHG
ncbi:uncharacterized protein RBU33_008315 isoform 2-T2 [Hipposideros larvatus]